MSRIRRRDNPSDRITRSLLGQSPYGTSRLVADDYYGNVAAPSGVTGTSAVTLAGVSQTGAGTVAISGAGAATLAGVSQTGAGTVAISGVCAAALAGVSQIGAGTVVSGSAEISGDSAITLAGVSQSGFGSVALSGAGFALLQGIVQQGAGVVVPDAPAIPPYDWTPPLDLATSTIIGQAMRYMRLAPVSRQDPDAEVLAALAKAYAESLGECLEASDWSFASVLALLPSASLPVGAHQDDGLPHSYQLPGDLLTIRRVGGAIARWRCDADLLRTNQPAPLTIRYTARISREAAMPATFKTAVALHIASLLGAQWAGAAVAADDIAMQAAMTLKQAMREDSRHAAPERALPDRTRADRAQASDDLGYGSTNDWASEAIQ